MVHSDNLGEQMNELTTIEFLKAVLKKLDEIDIKTEEEILLLDKVLYKLSNISKDYKMRLLTPQLQELHYFQFIKMAHPDYLGELMNELTATEFLQAALKKLDEINIKTEEEILLLDKVLYKISNISKDYKMRLLTPQLQEKFMQRMADMKLDTTNFLNMLKPYEHGNGPYTKPKPDIKMNLAGAPVVEIPDNSQAAFSTMPESNPEPPNALPSSDKSYRSYGNPGRSVERGGMTPKRNRSNSSSSSSSSSGSEDRRSSAGKRKEDNSRFSAKDGTSEKSGNLPAKYSFAMKKPDSSSRIVRAHGPDKDDYFERSSRAYEPRSERGEASNRERDFRRSPEPYYPARKPYRGTKKMYRPPQSYKH